MPWKKRFRSVTPPAGADKEALRRALAAWEARTRYVEQHQQGFELSYFWIRYNVENRSFVPLIPMRAYAAGPGGKG